MSVERGSKSAIDEIVKLSRGIKVTEMAAVAEAAKKAGGTLVGIDAIDDDWCGNGRIRFKWPPKQQDYFSLLDYLVGLRIDHEVLINGIPVPDEVLLTVKRSGWVARQER